MGSKADEIQQVEAEIVALSAALNQRVQDIHLEADDRVLEAIRESEADQRRLHARLARLQVMRAVEDYETSAAPRPPSTPPASDRRPAGAVILAALAERGTLPSGALDDLVVEAGWTKAAAVKAKQVLKRGGAAVSDKGLWSITDAGRQKVSEVSP